MYVTPQDLIAEFGETELVELTDRADPRTYAVDLAVAQIGCDRADAEINGALSLRYTLPLPSTPELLRFIARDLARFYLYHAEPPTIVKARFDAARTTLRDIQAGRQTLGVDGTGAGVVAESSDLAQFDTGTKVWARGGAW